MRRLLLLSIVLTACRMLTSCSHCVPDRLPDIPLADLQGNEISATTLTDNGTPLLISFYATWCDPCAKELNAITKVYDRWVEEYGANMIIVAIDKYPSQAAKVIESVMTHQWGGYDLYFDLQGDFIRTMDIKTIPTMLIVDRKGMIISTIVGYEAENTAKIENILKNMTDKR